MLSRRHVLAAPALTLAQAPAPLPGPAPRVDLAPVPRPSRLESEPRGFVDILPGRKLRGWTRVPIPADGPFFVEAEVWRVDPKTKLLSCAGHLPESATPKAGSHEFLRYDRELTDFVFHVEWRYTDPGRKGWNSGVFARNSFDAKIWHQAQLPGGGAAYWFGNSIEANGQARRMKIQAAPHEVRPAGEWNTYEITARGSTLELWANGATVCTWTGVLVPRGYLGLEAEYHAAEFRNLRLQILR
jgi:hypothetical protein